MRRFGIFLVSAIILITLSVAPAIAERVVVKKKVTNETVVVKKGHFKFELEGTVIASANTTAGTFDVKIKSVNKAVRRVGKKRGDTITVKTTDKTTYVKATKPPGDGSLADLKEGVRVHIRGTVNKNGDVVTFEAVKIIIKPTKTKS